MALAKESKWRKADKKKELCFYCSLFILIFAQDQERRKIMAKRKLEEVSITTPSLEALMTMQPNNVTFGSYDLSDIQDNILTLIGTTLQGVVHQEREFDYDQYGQPVITIPCSPAGGEGHKARVFAAAWGMRKKDFRFKWIDPKIHKTVETAGIMVTTVHDIKGTDEIKITLNPWALPVLLYYGFGVGGTLFSKNVSLKLRGNYTKRIYKMLCAKRTMKNFHYYIDAFKADLHIDEKATNHYLSKYILTPSMERIKESESDVWFDYELICKNPTKGRKPKADMIVFTIHSRNPIAPSAIQANDEHYQMYREVYNWVYSAVGGTGDTAQRFVDRANNNGWLPKIHNRICYYDDRVCDGSMTRKHAENSLLKMLREEYEFEK